MAHEQKVELFVELRIPQVTEVRGTCLKVLLRTGRLKNHRCGAKCLMSWAVDMFMLSFASVTENTCGHVTPMHHSTFLQPQLLPSDARESVYPSTWSSSFSKKRRKTGRFDFQKPRQISSPGASRGSQDAKCLLRSFPARCGTARTIARLIHAATPLNIVFCWSLSGMPTELGRLKVFHARKLITTCLSPALYSVVVLLQRSVQLSVLTC